MKRIISKIWKRVLQWRYGLYLTLLKEVRDLWSKRQIGPDEYYFEMESTLKSLKNIKREILKLNT